MRSGGLCASSSVRGGLWLVKGPIAQHGKQDVASASGQRDECLVVTLALPDLARVVGARDRGSQGRKRGEKQGSFEHLVATPGGVFAADGRA